MASRAILEAIDADRLHCIQIREALIDIAKGVHGVDPETGRKLDDDKGARKRGAPGSDQQGAPESRCTSVDLLDVACELDVGCESGAAPNRSL